MQLLLMITRIFLYEKKRRKKLFLKTILKTETYQKTIYNAHTFVEKRGVEKKLLDFSGKTEKRTSL